MYMNLQCLIFKNKISQFICWPSLIISSLQNRALASNNQSLLWRWECNVIISKRNIWSGVANCINAILECKMEKNILWTCIKIMINSWTRNFHMYTVYVHFFSTCKCASSSKSFDHVCAKQILQICVQYLVKWFKPLCSISKRWFPFWINPNC